MIKLNLNLQEAKAKYGIIFKKDSFSLISGI